MPKKPYIWRQRRDEALMLTSPYIPKVENLETELPSNQSPVELFDHFQCKMEECNAIFHPEIIILDTKLFNPKITGYFSCPKCGTWYTVKILIPPEEDVLLISDTNLMTPSKQFAAR